VAETGDRPGQAVIVRTEDLASRNALVPDVLVRRYVPPPAYGGQVPPYNAGGLWGLEAGVAVSVNDDTRTATHLAELGPGEFFGEMSLLTGEPRSATVTALVETCLLTIDKDIFRPCLEAEPRLAEALERFLVDRKAAQATAISREPQPPQEHDLLRRIREFFAI
jgi:CRP-like cAMP-binding protein